MQFAGKLPAIVGKQTRNCRQDGLHPANEVNFNLRALIHAVACFLSEQLAS